VPVGRLIYGSSSQSFEFDDRLLAHLRIVFMNKLRRREAFMFNTPPTDGLGTRALWISPAVPLVFHFYGGRSPVLNGAWVDVLMKEAGSVNGLSILDEPARPAPRPT